LENIFLGKRRHRKCREYIYKKGDIENGWRIHFWKKE
jgi:hypothetical protein